MSSAELKLLQHELYQLDEREFELFCRWYLQDLDYRSQSGKYPGPDGGIDLYGYTPTGSRFVGHCTTMSARRRQEVVGKFLHDVTSWLEQTARREVAEVWLFSRERFVDAAEDVTVGQAVIEVYRRYTTTGTEPVVNIRSGDQLVREASSALRAGFAFRMLDSRRRANLEDPEAFIYEDKAYYGATDDVIPLLATYSDDLPVSLREERLTVILEASWRAITADPICAIHVRDAEIATSLVAVLSPVVELALRAGIMRATLRRAADELSALRLSTPGAAAACDTFLMRILRAAFYQPGDEPPNVELLESCITENEFWLGFCCDMFLRSACGFLRHGSSLTLFFQTRALIFRDSPAGASLAQLWTAFVEPMRFIRQPRDVVINRLRSAAASTTNAMIAQWVVTAVGRTLPLLDASEDDTEWGTLSLSIVDAIPPSISATSSYIQFWRLRAYLLAFRHKKNVVSLRKFEDAFLGAKRHLFRNQITHLQLEYACALLLAVQSLSDDELLQTRFAEVVQRPEPLETTARLVTPYVLRVRPERPRSVLQRGTAVLWLGSYAQPLVKHYLLPRVDREAAALLGLRSATSFLPLRAGIQTRVIESIRLHADTADANFWAKAAAIFMLVGWRHNLPLAWHCARAAVDADEYVLQVSAKHVAHLLYALWFYATEIDREEIGKLTNILGERTRVGDEMPRLHWAYYAGILWHERQDEGIFTAELWHALEPMPLSTNVLDDTRIHAVFRDKICLIARRYRLTSLFAAVLDNDYGDPETWNLLGTTIRNISDENDVGALQTVSQFYNLGRCFASARRQLNAKFTFNYIRTTAALHRKADIVDYGFIRSTLDFLETPNAKHFTFNTECVMPYIGLLRKILPSLGIALRDEIVNRVARIGWLPDEHRQIALGVAV